MAEASSTSVDSVCTSAMYVVNALAEQTAITINAENENEHQTLAPVSPSLPPQIEINLSLPKNSPKKVGQPSLTRSIACEDKPTISPDQQMCEQNISTTDVAAVNMDFEEGEIAPTQPAAIVDDDTTRKSDKRRRDDSDSPQYLHRRKTLRDDESSKSSRREKDKSASRTPSNEIAQPPMQQFRSEADAAAWYESLDPAGKYAYQQYYQQCCLAYANSSGQPAGLPFFSYLQFVAAVSSVSPYGSYVIPPPPGAPPAHLEQVLIPPPPPPSFSAEAEESSQNGADSNNYCKVCKVTCSSAQAFQQHVAGRKHSQMVIRQRRVTDEGQNDTLHHANAAQLNRQNSGSNRETHYLDTGRPAFLQCQLDACRAPLLGLDHVIEIIQNNDAPPQYLCYLCNSRSNMTTIMAHLTGRPHRETFLREFRFDLYSEVAALAYDKDAQLHTLNLRSMDAERQMGRAQIIQKYESASPDMEQEYGDGYNDNKRGHYSENVATYNNIRGRGGPPDRQVANSRRGLPDRQVAISRRGLPDRQVAISRRGQHFAARGRNDRQVAIRGGVRPPMADHFQNGQQFGHGAEQIFQQQQPFHPQQQSQYTGEYNNSQNLDEGDNNGDDVGDEFGDYEQEDGNNNDEDHNQQQQTTPSIGGCDLNTPLPGGMTIRSLLDLISKSAIKNEADADMAYRICTALTKSLMAYRLKVGDPPTNVTTFGKTTPPLQQNASTLATASKTIQSSTMAPQQQTNALPQTCPISPLSQLTNSNIQMRSAPSTVTPLPATRPVETLANIADALKKVCAARSISSDLPTTNNNLQQKHTNNEQISSSLLARHIDYNQQQQQSTSSMINSQQYSIPTYRSVDNPNEGFVPRFVTPTTIAAMDAERRQELNAQYNFYARSMMTNNIATTSTSSALNTRPSLLQQPNPLLRSQPTPPPQQIDDNYMRPKLGSGYSQQQRF